MAKDLTIPTAESCHKDVCSSNDVQFTRVLRLWHHDPYGWFGESESNLQRLRVATEFFICNILKRATDPVIHEYWCDGVDFVEHSVTDGVYNFGGCCIVSDHQANAMWLHPFELKVSRIGDNELPTEVRLCLGLMGEGEETLCKRYPAGRNYRLYRVADALYGSRPQNDQDWAVIVSLHPYSAT